MFHEKLLSLSSGRQLLYASGSAAFTMLERLVLLYIPFFYLPPAEYKLPDLLSDQIYLGVFTIIGAAFFFGRIFDGLADPLIAALSDNNRARIGRRKMFLLLGGLPLAISAFLLFSPPSLSGPSAENGLWLALLLIFFYLSFTLYVNPYLALLPELGHSNRLRINLSTMIAFFGLLGMVAVTVIFPLIVGIYQEQGLELREAYRVVVAIYALGSLILLYSVTLGFDESKHCLPIHSRPVNAFQSLLHTYGVRPFRLFLAGEMFLQFAMNMVTLGMIYYVVIIFKEPESFLSVLAGVTIGGALISFPLVNIAAKQVGKKKVITGGVLCLAICSICIFSFSFFDHYFVYYANLGLFALAGLPLAILVILINPTIADLALADFYLTGIRREAMFFGARAIPLKLTIALAGVIFTFLLTSFGRNINQPLGVQLTILVVSLAAFGSYLCFRRYPEKQVLNSIAPEKEKQPQ